MDVRPIEQQLAAAVGTVFPAAQLLVVNGGATVIDAAVGDCDPGMQFDLASLTKALCTTTLAMRLIDAGRLALATPLRPGVTVQHALGHATGLPAWLPLHELCADADDRRQAIVARTREQPLTAAPGSRSVYSDLGFILLGDAIERAGGARLDAQWDLVAASLGVEVGFDPAPSRCVPTRRSDGETGPLGAAEQALCGVVNDDNALAMEGVAGHAGLFGSAREVSRTIAALVAAWGDHAAAWCDRARPPIARAETVRRFLAPAGVADSTWCLGWDRPSPGASQAGARWPRDGVGHLGFTGCSIWIDPPRARWVVLLSNRVLYGQGSDEIKRFRPALHDLIVETLDAG